MKDLINMAGLAFGAGVLLFVGLPMLTALSPILLLGALLFLIGSLADDDD